jgi:hypothetical protein
MNIKAIFRTSENRGDHAADVNIVFDINDNETIKDFVVRCGMAWPSETIELKIVKES